MKSFDCIYWSYPNWFKAFVNKTVPKKQVWTIKAWKTKDGTYAFNIPPFIWNEALCGGTEKCIDSHVEAITGEKPKVGDVVTLTASVIPMKGYTTILEWEVWSGPGSYWDKKAGMEAWLCPVAEVMFGLVPQNIWVKVSPKGYA